MRSGLIFVKVSRPAGVLRVSSESPVVIKLLLERNGKQDCYILLPKSNEKK